MSAEQRRKLHHFLNASERAVDLADYRSPDHDPEEAHRLFALAGHRADQALGSDDHDLGGEGG